jgi:hypothetical protein
VCTLTHFKVLSSTSKYSSIPTTRRRTEFTISPSTHVFKTKWKAENGDNFYKI